MDFLMLLPGGARVVLEVDGKQHYADSEGRADPGRYAVMATADRELRLAGYDVYRFGATELREESGKAAVGAFFDALFIRYGISVSSPYKTA
jgi:very-short-patch-repair endonuclease